MEFYPCPPSDKSPPPAPPPAQKHKGVVGKRVVVRLTSGVDRMLSCLDGLINTALEQTVKYVNRVVTNRYGEGAITALLYISAPEAI
ncbi:hypothetical protein BYT27DRAFT_7220495 [Phlegmacium glaucopus]|nr:hypothetical protein BYT27DRAFT_7220495 [Phlegmacium glaucopus]